MKCPFCKRKKRTVMMKTDVINQRYVCPKCNSVINWFKTADIIA